MTEEVGAGGGGKILEGRGRGGGKSVRAGEIWEHREEVDIYNIGGMACRFAPSFTPPCSHLPQGNFPQFLAI